LVQLLADENQHPLVVNALRSKGYAVDWIAESSSGAKDEEILSRPDIPSKILLTYDRDFGDLIFNRGYPAPFAILYTRLNRARPSEIANRLLALLETGVAAGHMTTVTEDGLRMKSFPLGAANA
jgi:predicted nuclease of predicted toxin-antitoxin system